MLGAQGVNIGTRFLATRESPIVDAWKQAIIDAVAQDAVQADVWNDIAPGMGTTGYGTVVRALRTPFLDRWSAKRDDALREMPQIREEIAKASEAGRFHDLMMFGGQSAGAIRDLPSAADVVRAIAEDAEAALLRASRLTG
jgi:NAD(P)H-dependent flavin oxidoreductase YrpB (nitropropane dioxygenase family)